MKSIAQLIFETIIYIVFILTVIFIAYSYSNTKFVKREPSVQTIEEEVIPDNKQPLYVLSPNKEA